MKTFIEKNTKNGPILIEIEEAIQEYAIFCIECEKNNESDFYPKFETWLCLTDYKGIISV